MLFNSYVFIFVFLPLVILAYALAPQRFRLLILIAASLIFYSCWNWKFTFVLLASITVNLVLAQNLHKNKSRFLLIIGLIFNLGLLGFFKYFNFFIDNLKLVAPIEWAVPNIILPLGISFYTFQKIEFLVDVYRGLVKEIRLRDYFLFVTFFPQLIAGPIVSYKEVMWQFHEKARFVLKSKNLALGLMFFSIGLFKKTVIADTFATWVGNGFDHANEVTFIEAWGAATSYAFQIYFDFSGYSDMAVGLAKMFNIDLPLNFNCPYQARNIVDFWARWHMTLTRFLRNYLYYPLGGSRKGEKRRYLNIMIVMFLGGFWHGAGWTFIVWGILHGLLICSYHAWEKIKSFEMPPWIARTLTFVIVVFTWVFFRADSLPDALAMAQTMLGSKGFKFSVVNYFFSGQLKYYVLIGTFIVLQFSPNWVQYFREHPEKICDYRVAMMGSLLFILGVLWINTTSEFLYFQF